MGDKKVAYRPTYVPTQCDVTKKKWYSSMLRSCPEPNVRKRFYHKVYDDKNNLIGVDTTVCLYVCQKCKYGHNADGGWYCNYERNIN